MLTERRQQLLASPRWSALAAFIERWYARPLANDDGPQLTAVHGRYGVPELELAKQWVAEAGRVAGGAGGSSPAIEVRTKEPRRVLERLLAAMPAELLAHVTIATRPVAINVFDVLYPAGTTTFRR